MFKFVKLWLSFFSFNAVEGEGGSLEGNAAVDAFANILNPPSEEEVKESEALETAKQAKELAGEAETSEEDADDTEEEEGEKITIEIDGKMVELTPKEVAEAYKNGLRQDDYTRKTMAAAEERKAADAEVQKARTERAEYHQKLTTYAIQLQGTLAESQAINFDELRESDPIEYLKQKDLLEKRQLALNQAYQEHQQIEQLNAQEAEQAKIQYLQTQQQELLAKLPAWKDETKAKAEKEDIKAYLKGQGFSDQDIAGVGDHRQVLLIRNAMLFDKLMKQAPAATKKVASAPAKAERPGVSNLSDNAQRDKVMKQVRSSKSLTTDQAASAFSALI
jgi:hypothetical protein